VTEELLAEFVSEEVDAVEFVYTRFVNLITSEASIRTILPLRITGIESDADEVSATIDV
jgi:F-type H+-transporting ATPase subunit gamma